MKVHKKSRQILAVLAILALVAGTLHYVFDPRNLQRYTDMELHLEKVRTMNERLADENARLALEIAACRHDPRYAERIARQDLHQIRDGDLVYVLEPDER